MCTVTCLIKTNDIILTSNRDIPKERVHSKPPKIYKINSKNILFPLDPVGNGSWIGTNDSEIICLLNHKGEQNGVESRGLIIREILSGKLSIKDLNRVCKKYSPFKLIYLNKNEDTNGFKAFYGKVKDGNVMWMEDKNSYVYMSMFDEGELHKLANQKKDSLEENPEKRFEKKLLLSGWMFYFLDL